MRIGLDIGGTKIEAILATNKGEIKKTFRMPAEVNKGRAKVLANLVHAINQVDNGKVKEVGISFAGVLKDGKVLKAVHISCFDRFDLKTKLESLTKKKIRIENDANCFALAEQKRGACKGKENILGIIIGTGIGAGVVIKGQIHSGKNNSAGEVGKIRIMKGKTFEELCSGPGVSARFIAAGGNKEEASPKEIFKSKSRIAKDIVNETIEVISYVLANQITSFDPDAIVLGGGLSNVAFYKEINKHVQEQLFLKELRATKILKNKLGDSSGTIGAVMLWDS